MNISNIKAEVRYTLNKTKDKQIIATRKPLVCMALSVRQAFRLDLAKAIRNHTRVVTHDRSKSLSLKTNETTFYKVVLSSQLPKIGSENSRILVTRTKLLNHNIKRIYL